MSSPSIARQSRNFAMGVSIIEGGKTHEVHQHDAEETIFILSGSGEITINQDEKIHLETGTVILLKPNEPHGLVAYGNESLQCLWVYAPPGPEKRFAVDEKCDVIVD